MVIRGYLSGHAAREYKAGELELLCGATPDGMKEKRAFPKTNYITCNQNRKRKTR